MNMLACPNLLDLDSLQARFNQEIEALLPREEDVQFFEEHGWYVSPQVIPEELLDLALIGCDRFYRGERDGDLPHMDRFANWQPQDGNVLRNNEFVARQIKEFQALTYSPIVAGTAARLSRSKAMRLLEEQIIYKPGPVTDWTGTVGWHTDLAYCSYCTSDKILTAWIPLVDCDETMGAVTYFDGSHQWEEFRDLKQFQQTDLDSLETRLSEAGRPIHKVTMNLKRGQMSFHHGWTIHGSSPNRSDRPRIVMAIHFQPDGNAFQPVPNPKGGLFHHYLDPFCRKLPNGYPDYQDSSVYPLLWSE
ncbi:MAG: phytanoyl-CoA dioxygenase family protein [Synechococcales bacterium]|nr:phytanoyl-CoA dioxygenase family protein [Synechococcales bacterium]